MLNVMISNPVFMSAVSLAAIAALLMGVVIGQAIFDAFMQYKRGKKEALVAQRVHEIRTKLEYVVLDSKGYVIPHVAQVNGVYYRINSDGTLSKIEQSEVYAYA